MRIGMNPASATRAGFLLLILARADQEAGFAGSWSRQICAAPLRRRDEAVRRNPISPKQKYPSVGIS
jgi:hypothetical protein